MSDDQTASTPERTLDDPAPEASRSAISEVDTTNNIVSPDEASSSDKETKSKNEEKKDSKGEPTRDIEKDDKDKDGESSKYIKLRVVGNHDTHGINFRLKYTTALSKLKKSYSNHVGIPTGNLRFLFDGRRISDEDTPKQLDMNDDDQIEVYHEQIGGV